MVSPAILAHHELPTFPATPLPTISQADSTLTKAPSFSQNPHREIINVGTSADSPTSVQAHFVEFSDLIGLHNN